MWEQRLRRLKPGFTSARTDTPISGARRRMHTVATTGRSDITNVFRSPLAKRRTALPRNQCSQPPSSHPPRFAFFLVHRQTLPREIFLEASDRYGMLRKLHRGICYTASPPEGNEIIYTYGYCESIQPYKRPLSC